jgi:carbon storage regulator CsrA
MLVITRRPGQKFIIGNKEVIITIIESSRYVVRIGVEASKDIYLAREEIFNQDKATKSRSLNGPQTNS